jgi:NitT/TauT family transport system ATP-binding protein
VTRDDFLFDPSGIIAHYSHLLDVNYDLAVPIRITGGNRMTAPNTRPDRMRGAALVLARASHKFDRDENRRPVLDQISLRIEPGELVAVLGPRGCGKSTLLRLAAGREPVSSGTILLDGEPPAATPHLILSKDPGLSARETVHAQVSAARDNRRGPEAPAPHVDQALRLLGLNRFAGACSRELTAGTAQRVSLATALVNDPRLLLLDDPFARLDPITRRTVQGDLVSLWQRFGFTALLATTDVDEAVSVASRIVVLGAESASIVLDLPLDCEFPRRPTDPCVASTRRVVLQSLDRASASQHASSRAPRWAEQSARPGDLALMIWPGDEPAARHASAITRHCAARQPIDPIYGV